MFLFPLSQAQGLAIVDLSIFFFIWTNALMILSILKKDCTLEGWGASLCLLCLYHAQWIIQQFLCPLYVSRHLESWSLGKMCTWCLGWPIYAESFRITLALSQSCGKLQLESQKCWKSVIGVTFDTQCQNIVVLKYQHWNWLTTNGLQDCV